MKTIFVVLCIFILSASAAVLKNPNNYLQERALFKKLNVHDISLQSTTISGNFSDYIDKTLDIIRNKTVATDSIVLPSYSDSFVYNILYFITSTVHLSLTSGNFSGLSDVKRNGDSLITYSLTSKKMTTSINLVFPKLEFDYEMEVKWIFSSSKARVIGTVKNATGTMTPSFNAKDLNITLDTWNFQTPQNIDIQIKDGGFTVNYLAASIQKELNNIFTEKIWAYTINMVLKNEVEKFLDTISKSLFKN